MSDAKSALNFRERGNVCIVRPKFSNLFSFYNTLGNLFRNKTRLFHLKSHDLPKILLSYSVWYPEDEGWICAYFFDFQLNKHYKSLVE